VNKSVPHLAVAPGKQAKREVRAKTKNTFVVSQTGFKYSLIVFLLCINFGNKVKNDDPNSIEERIIYIKREKEGMTSAMVSFI
jgi:hypothetical protein